MSSAPAPVSRVAEEFTLRIRRYDPESGKPAYWDEHTVSLEPHRSVLEGILQARNETDGSIAIRCSCRGAICGSCGVKVNGKAGLACHTHLDHAKKSAGEDGVIEIEPLGNMPVIKDLVVDMDAVHWKKIQRVTPWLIGKEPVPEREYIVDRLSMVDVTQTMACIQCGACVGDCLSLEVDPLFVGPAALAKAYRFVGDPRDAMQAERLKDLAEDPHGIYDCTHCFKCIEACPKGVAPMNQIMRLRRRAGQDHHIEDQNNGERHESAFVTLVGKYGLLAEAEVVPRSLVADSALAKFHPKAVKEIVSTLPFLTKALLRGKVTPRTALIAHKLDSKDIREVRDIYDTIHGRDERNEFNLYISGTDEDNAENVSEEAKA
ncbi:MAG: succinate dehydrogenase/fumarate reductase iron-sulfur subunit [Baekduia sp.]